MAFIETPRFPDSIARGAQRTIRSRTEIVTGITGIEQRNALSLNKVRLYEVRLPPRASASWSDWLKFVESLRGPADGFRLKDWADFSCPNDQGMLYPTLSGFTTGTVGYGYGLATHQLARKYSSWAVAEPRTIKKPISSGLVIRRGGVVQTAGAGAGQYALSASTGAVTFVADQTRAVSSHTVGSTHTFVLASAFSPNLATGGRLWVAGVTGTSASLLNGLPLEITNVSGPNVSVAVSTTSLNASGGTASFFPQPTETLTWSGEFDVPARFSSDDQIDVIVHRMAGGDMIMEAPSVQLIELLNP